MKSQLFISLVLFAVSNGEENVKVSVYYETLCPDSIAFINNQLYSNYKSFGSSLINLELVPYGFAKETDSNGTKTFTCQHGPDECYGNEVHGCVIDSQPITTTNEFVYCSESSNPPTSQENFKNWALKLTVYYEALCSDSANFITTQLYPNYKDFKEFLSIEFVPYGLARDGFNRMRKRYIFFCHHGTEECEANAYQACGLSQTDNLDVQMEFINCVMLDDNPDNSTIIEECADDVHLDYVKIKNCASSMEGDSILALNGKKTRKLKPILRVLPTVVFNDKSEIDLNIQDLAISNLTELICTKLPEPKPKLCLKDI